MTEAKHDWPGLIVAIAFVGLGLWVYIISSSFSEYAAIFPQTIAIIMIVASLANIIVLIRGKGKKKSKTKNLYRPLGLIGIVTIWAFLIPVLGFLVASVSGFLATMVLAKFSYWSKKDWIKFMIIGTLVVIVSYILFRFVLNVPL